MSDRKKRKVDRPTSATFGARLRLLRLGTNNGGKRLTQEGLARALGVSLFTVNGWERMETADTLRTGSLFALSDFFGVEPRWLARGIGRRHAAR